MAYSNVGSKLEEEDEEEEDEDEDEPGDPKLVSKAYASYCALSFFLLIPPRLSFEKTVASDGIASVSPAALTSSTACLRVMRPLRSTSRLAYMSFMLRNLLHVKARDV